MTSNQQQLIKQYFNSLVQDFIKDSFHKDITIVFLDSLGNSSEGETEGRTEKRRQGSEVKYAINFLNEYKNQDQWREIVAHEFAHLYLFTTTGEHDHNDRFYSCMERFESWLDNRWGLTPRKNKYYDKNQHVDIEKRKIDCSNCDKRKLPYSINGNCYECHQEKDKYNRISDLITNSEDLVTLERNWQIVKNSSIYTNSKKTFKKVIINGVYVENKEDNKTRLDRKYQIIKNDLNAKRKSVLTYFQQYNIKSITFGILIVGTIIYLWKRSKSNKNLWRK